MRKWRVRFEDGSIAILNAIDYAGAVERAETISKGATGIIKTGIVSVCLID